MNESVNFFNYLIDIGGYDEAEAKKIMERFNCYKETAKDKKLRKEYNEYKKNTTTTTN